MSHYKTVRLDPEQYTMLSGAEKHEVELPFAEHLDLWVDWKANRDVMLWLYFTDGKRLPYLSGLSGHFSIRTRNVLSVVLECTKSTTICVCVSFKDLAVTEKADWTPVEITPPDPAQLKLGEAIRREMMRLGVLSDGDETLDVSEEDNLEEDDDGDEFGAGFMEDEEPVPLPTRARARARSKADADESRSGDAAGGDNGDSGNAGDAGNAKPIE